MAEGISGCMPIALRSVGDAIRLDSENKTKEAYCQYLSCIIYISQVLKDDAWDKDLRSVYNRDTAKLFQLLHQCQERALTIISSQASDPPTYQSSQTQTPKHLLPAPDGVQRRYSDSSLPDQQLLTPQSGSTRKPPNPTPPGVTLSTPPAERDLHLPSPPGSPRVIRRCNSPACSPRLIPQRNGSRDPLERAYKENQQLILAYRTRIQNQGGRNQNVTSKSLSLLRRMSENLVIAQAREQALKKKLLERQQRLEEETNRRFGPAVLSTREDQEQRLVYTKILEFEQETVWPKHLRERLKLMPEDSKLIKEIITKIFCSSDHPLTQFLLQYQFLVYRKLAPLVKDVGIPYEKSARKAESEENKEMLEETCTNQRFSIINNGENEDSGAKDDRKSFSVSDINEASVENKSEFETGETLNDPEDVSEGVNVGDEGIKVVTNDLSENHGLESQENGSDVGKRNEVDNNCSGIDLKKLKAFLEDESLPRTVNNDEAQDTESGNAPKSTAREITDKSSEFESYYRELEEDMLGWESSDDDSDHVTASKNDVDLPSETGNSKNDVDVPSETANSKNDEDRPSETVYSEDNENRPSELVNIKNNIDIPSETANGKNDENRPSETVNFSKNDIDIPSEIANSKSDEDRPTETANSKSDADRPSEIADCKNDQNRPSETANEEKPIAEQKEENTQIEESGTDVSLHRTDLDDVMTSDKLESIASDLKHLPQLLDVTVTDDKQEPNQMHPSREESSETPQDSYSSENTNKSNLEDSTAPTCIKPCDPRESTPEDSDSEQVSPTPGNFNAFESNNTHTINTSDSSDVEASQVPTSSLSTDEGFKDEHVTVAAAEEVRSQLKNILVDIRFFLEKLQKLLMLAYEQLDTPAGRDLCYSCVEYPFFKPLWPMLLAVLRQLNYDKEVCLADVMTANIQKNPEDLGVPHRLCMDDQKALDSTGNTYPYQMAVEELHKVVTLFCPLEKLECIVRTSRCICQCVEDYWEMKGKPRHSSETAIGCDDLLPILSFVVIRSGMAQLISECDAMEEFIPEGYLMGEEGYCLTTLLTALAYLATLKDQ